MNTTAARALPGSTAHGAATASRRRWLRWGGGLLLAGLAGCERVHSQMQWSRMKLIEERESTFGRLAVVELSGRRYLAYGPGTSIIYQSVQDIAHPLELAAPYTRLMMLGAVYAEPHTRMLQIGVGAGNMASYTVRTFPDTLVDGVDIDPNAIEMGQRHFGLLPGPRLRLHVADGRAWLAASKSQFDVVMLDAYDDQTIPATLSDDGFFALVAQRLAPAGVVMQNLSLPIVNARKLIETMRRTFDQIDLYRIGESVVLAAYKGPARESAGLRARAEELDRSLRPAHLLSDALRLRVADL